MNKLVWYVALGSGIGGAVRLLLTNFIQQRVGTSFPLGTLIINITGSFILGFLIRYAIAGPGVAPEIRALLTTGFCGGYTTFSTYEWETFKLVRDGSWALALANALGSLLAGFIGVLLAVALVGLLFPRR